MNPTAPTLEPGLLLAERYRLDRLLARGGMSDVYVAVDERLDRAVAVKVFRTGPAGGRERFDREVSLLASLDHPGLVRVFDAGEHGGDAFVVLELVEGPTLADRSATVALSSSEVATLGAAVADALDHVHQRGVVHRDVTPSNILCGPDGRPRLADFGIARLVEGPRLTATAMTIGTPAYMSPEQVQGDAVTPAADVYALGLVLLELLTGRRAFEGTPQEVAVARLARQPDTSEAPEAWREILSAMTDRAPANRIDAAEARDQLTALLANADKPTMAVLAGPDPPATVVASVPSTQVLPAALAPAPTGAAEVGALVATAWGHRRRVAAALVAVVLLLAVAVASSDDAPRPASLVDDPVEVTTTLPHATTTLAPTTTAPAPKPDDRGRGNGNGNGKKDGGEDD